MPSGPTQCKPHRRILEEIGEQGYATSKRSFGLERLSVTSWNTMTAPTRLPWVSRIGAALSSMAERAVSPDNCRVIRKSPLRHLAQYPIHRILGRLARLLRG